ncbi:LCP family protein [Microbacterium sp. CFH 31415]|uniref:LCP family protein n=1 Tax=Microbacterium sp. CFH 31415 TaxID=2921732 RepID=UPI0035AC0107
MSTAEPRRLQGAAAPAAPRKSAPLTQERPMRFPDASSRAVMTRRGWWLVVLNFLVPGSAQVLAGNRRLGRVGIVATLVMWALAIAAALGALLARSVVLAIGTNWFVLLLAQGLLIAYAVLWLILTVDTLRLVRLVRTGRRARFGIAAASVVLLVLACGTAAYGANVAGTTRETLGAIFGASGPSVEPSDGYYNILLLGADHVPSNDSKRFDSISVVSINAETGATTITGFPRDMPGFPFSEGPMQDRYPNGHEGHADATCGWGSGINQLNTEVEVCQDGSLIYPDAVSKGSAPGIEATKDAVEGILGIEVPHYVTIDMYAFEDLIDALGGVEIDVKERIPIGGPGYTGEPLEDWVEGWIEPGTQRMDGFTAQWYARSRHTTSDFDRMRRQRELQQAILAQFTPQVVLTRFQEVADAGADMVSTDLPSSFIPTLLDLALKAKQQEITTIELTPDGGIDEHDPDWAYIKELVQTKLHPPKPTPEG